MTHRLQKSTRLMATVTCGGAAVAAVDVIDLHGATTAGVVVAVLLALAAVLVGRLHRVTLEVDNDVVVVRNVLSTHRVPAEEVAEIRAGQWRSAVVLIDGTEIPTLLRDSDLEADADATPSLLSVDGS